MERVAELKGVLVDLEDISDRLDVKVRKLVEDNKDNQVNLKELIHYTGVYKKYLSKQKEQIYTEIANDKKIGNSFNLKKLSEFFSRLEKELSDLDSHIVKSILSSN